MEFHLTKKHSDRQGQWLLPIPEGQTICYEEPLHTHILQLTMCALQESQWAQQFHGFHYRLITNSKLIEEFVPASEYYKISWMAMSEKYHSALITMQSLETNAKELSQTYGTRRTFTGINNQPKLTFTDELYRLRTDFAALLFLIRSSLDQFAALIQFLSGPKAHQFSSFADVMKKVTGNKPAPEIPEQLRIYLNNSCAWFWRMRDIRDYIAHHGFVSLHLVQSPPNELKFFIHHRLDMLDLAREFMNGFQLLLDSIDCSFADHIRSA